MDRHFPCGHWHKGPLTAWAESSATIGLCVRYVGEDEDPDNGIALAYYNIATDTWTYGGKSVGFALPNLACTLRIASDYAAFFSSLETTPDYVGKMRIHIFEDGTATTTDLWSYDANNTYDSTDHYDVMDLNDDGLIACLAYVRKAAGDTKNAWAVRVSTDKGVNWTDPYYFPTIDPATYGRCAKVKIDGSGNIWICMQDAPNKCFYIYKSTDNGANWSLIATKTIDVYTDFGVYSLDSTGQYQYLTIEVVVTGEKRLYKSSDYGATWSDATILDDTNWHTKHVSNGTRLVIPRLTGLPVSFTSTFKVSTDSGASFSDTTPPYAAISYYPSFQNSGDNLVFTQAKEDFADGTNYAGVLYSLDGGETFTAAHVPATDDFTYPGFNASVTGGIQDVDIISSSSSGRRLVTYKEPVVWTLPKGNA